MMKFSPPPPDSIRDHISYDPETGFFTRLTHHTPDLVGGRADRPAKRNYRHLCFEGRRYLAHRLAWFFVHGKWPEMTIDHINGDPSDNQISNLRLADMAQNSSNRRPTGRFLKGVTMHRCGRFQASIKVRGRQIHLGLHETEEGAHSAYAIAAAEHHGEFARLS